MLNERELEKVALWIALPFFFGALWFSAGSRLALDLGESYSWPTKLPR